MHNMIMIGLGCALLIVFRDIIDTLVKIRREQNSVAMGIIWLLPACLAIMPIATLFCSLL